jgi:hypothetical protein
LPGTAIEMEMVKNIANNQNKPITVFLQSDVSESMVKSLSASNVNKLSPQQLDLWL